MKQAKCLWHALVLTRSQQHLKVGLLVGVATLSCALSCLVCSCKKQASNPGVTYKVIEATTLRERASFEAKIGMVDVFQEDVVAYRAILGWSSISNLSECLSFTNATSNQMAFVRSFRRGELHVFPKALLDFERRFGSLTN